MRRLGQPAVASPSQPHPPEHEYAFLVGTLVDRATLDEAEAEAAQCGATIHEVLLAAGRISQLDYAAVLARRLGVPVVAWNTDLDPGGAAHRSPAEAGMPAHIGGRPFRVLSATEATPATLFHHVLALRAQGTDVALAPQLLVDAALEVQTRPERLDRAVLGLLRAQPASSAGKKAAAWQTIAGWGTIGLLIGGFTVLPDATLAALTALSPCRSYA